MQKILLAIIASAVAVTMLSTFGSMTAFADPSPGVPGGGAQPPGQCTGAQCMGGAHPGANTVTCQENPMAGPLTTPGNSGTSGGAHTANHVYAGSGAGANGAKGGAVDTGQPGGTQYDVSCYQQTQHNP